MCQHTRDTLALHSLYSLLLLAAHLKVLVFLKSGRRAGGSLREEVEVRGRELRGRRGTGVRVQTGHPAWNLCLLPAAAHLEQVQHCLIESMCVIACLCCAFTVICSLQVRLTVQFKLNETLMSHLRCVSIFYITALFYIQ